MTKTSGSDFQLERYKYVLQQVQHLNENLHRFLAIYQTLCVAIVSGGIGLFAAWKNLGIDPGVARASIRGVYCLLAVLSLFVVAMIVAGVANWFDYRKEEADLFNAAVGGNYRRYPSIRGIWRWHETYLVLFVALIPLFVGWFVEAQVIPVIR